MTDYPYMDNTTVPHRFDSRWVITKHENEFIVTIHGHEVCICSTADAAIDEISLAEGVSESSRTGDHEDGSL